MTLTGTIEELIMQLNSMVAYYGEQETIANIIKNEGQH